MGPEWVCLHRAEHDAPDDEVDSWLVERHSDDGYRDQIAAHLWFAGRDAAHDALINHNINREVDPFVDAPGLTAGLREVLLAGMAVEWLVRALVAYHDPLLLADPQHIDSKIAFSRGAKQREFYEASTFRTNGFDEALQIADKLYDGLSFKTDALAVMSARNLAAHMGIAVRGQAGSVADQMLSVVHGALVVRGLSAEQFWHEDLRDLVTARADRSGNHRHAVVEQKLVVARRRWTDVMSYIDGPERQQLFGALEERSINGSFVQMVKDDHNERGAYHILRRRCPVDNALGELVVYVPEADYSGALGTFAEMEHFDCPVCGLHLTPDEMTYFPQLDAVPVSDVLPQPTRSFPLADFFEERDQRRGQPSRAGDAT